MCADGMNLGGELLVSVIEQQLKVFVICKNVIRYEILDYPLYMITVLMDACL